MKEMNNSINEASIESQSRLAEILTDSPRLVSLNGTEWEVRALRMGTQWLIAKKCCDIVKADSQTFGDVVKQFAVDIPSVLEVITLALLNDRRKIFKDGIDGNGYSDLYKDTYNTLKWDCDVKDFGNLLMEVLQLLDVNFFYQALDMLQIFRASVTARKKTMKEVQKSSAAQAK